MEPWQRSAKVNSLFPKFMDPYDMFMVRRYILFYFLYFACSRCVMRKVGVQISLFTESVSVNFLLYAADAYETGLKLIIC
jgi:hypothetical protein